MKNNNLCRILRGQIKAVQRRNDANVKCRRKFEHVDLMLWIQVIGRLVEHQNLWLLGKCASEEDALAFTTGKR